MRKTIFLLLLYLSIASIANGEVFFSDDFESGGLGGAVSKDGTRWSGNGVRVSVSNENTRSGNHALKFLFKGSNDLSNDSWAEQRYEIGSGGRSEFYLSYWAYFPTNYVVRDAAGTDNNKIGSTWADTYSVQGRYNIEISGVGGEIGIRTRRDPNPPSGSVSQAMCPDAGGILKSYPGMPKWDGLYSTRGKWTHWEFHFKMDDGSGNGASQLWINGELVISETNVSHIGAPCKPFYIKNGYLLGWANSGFNQDTTVYIDDVVFSSTYSGVDGDTSPAPKEVQAPVGFQLNN